VRAAALRPLTPIWYQAHVYVAPRLPRAFPWEKARELKEKAGFLCGGETIAFFSHIHQLDIVARTRNVLIKALQPSPGQSHVCMLDLWAARL